MPKRKSGRNLYNRKVYKHKGYLIKFNYTTQGYNDEKIPMLYNLLEGPIFDIEKYKGTINISNSSKFTVECIGNVLVEPKDRFYLEDENYGKVQLVRLVDLRNYNNSNKRNKNSDYEQIVIAG